MQGRLFPVADGPVCAFGEPLWGPHHPLCDAEAGRLEAAFWRKVQAGELDTNGNRLRATKGRQRPTT